MSNVGSAHPLISTCATIIFLAATLSINPAYSDPDLGEISAASNYCTNYKGMVKLSEDRTILCFDGAIMPDQEAGPFHDLRPNGFFVMRNPGGFPHTAITLSNILGEKNATVVLYDYCLSACANYFFIASSRTYVRKDTIVAWHRSSPKYDCRPVGIEFVARRYRERYGYSNDVAMRYAEALCNTTELATRFFRQRGIDPRHTYAPQTLYTRKIVELALNEAANKQSIFWMWNPRNHGDYFKSRIIYESYPNSQYEVDETVSRLRLRARIFYDP